MIQYPIQYSTNNIKCSSLLHKSDPILVPLSRILNSCFVNQTLLNRLRLPTIKNCFSLSLNIIFKETITQHYRNKLTRDDETYSLPICKHSCIVTFKHSFDQRGNTSLIHFILKTKQYNPFI